MLELLNVRFTFSLRTTFKNKDGKSPIVLRISFRGERRDVFTGLYCFEKDWDRSAAKVARSDEKAKTLNQNLEMILQSAKNSFDEMKFSREIFTIGELIDKMKGKEEKPTLLIDYLKEGTKVVLKRVGTEIVRPTYNKYNRGILYMQEFLEAEYKVKNFSLQKVNITLIERYFQFLRNAKNIGHNTACKYLACVKTILSPAVREGLIKSDPFLGLRITSKPVFRHFLSQEEIDKIASLQLDDPDLDRKRDIFLFACYTGLAYVDLQQLNSTHLLKEADGSWYIRKPRQKTGQDSVGIPKLGETKLYNYSYDQLNRIVRMDAWNGFDAATSNWENIDRTDEYQERIAYDANGNILKYRRNGHGGVLDMDSLSYAYNRNGDGRLTNNRLRHVKDAVIDGNYPEDIDNQANDNYEYDAIGNLVKDVKEGITSIEWTVYGKIRSITKSDGTVIVYTYDVSGNRISKGVTKEGTTTTTWYSRDAQGNTMAIYTGVGDALPLTEQHLYGSSRLGVWNRAVDMDVLPNENNSTFTRGNKFFELSNHLGNVLVTISDKKIGVDNNSDGTVDYYTADVITANDYYPFGSLMPGRKFAANGLYRYGFNGKENDNEVKGEGNQQDYGMRIYDPRLGRFLSVDPIARDYPWYTPYQFAGNMPIKFIDLDGLEPASTDKIYKGADGNSYLFGGDQNPELFTGNETNLQNNPGTKIKPEAGTVRSFTINGDNFKDGNSRRFVALFDKNSGKFTSYGWDKDANYTYDKYLNEVRKNVLTNLEHENDPMWDPDLPGDQAGKRALGLGVSLALPSPVLKTTTAAANATKATTTVLGKYPDYVNLASKLKANVFNIPAKVWDKMTAAEQWAANVKFLDQAIARGDKILLSNPVKDITKVTGAFRKELEYLIEKGFKLSSDGTQMIK